ncbi:fluoride efflux transporter CrcB [Methanolobus sp. ZRKC3]|uniref:fluoride efflux transporter CrcB n=1 Tax=Methanolobus sp. ZRKC3 TaxID=3125786 RepID=UPI0032469C86
MVSELFLVGIGGFFGAILRYTVSGALPRIREIPTGTLAVNIIGSFILAAMTFSAIDGTLRYFVSIGMLGSFTTFSTFAYESFRMMEEGEGMYFLLNIIMNAGACLGAVAVASLMISP